MGIACEGLRLLAQTRRSDIQNHTFFSCMKIKRLSQFTLLITMRLGQFTVLFHSHSIDCKGYWWYNLKLIQSYCQGWRRLPLSYKGRLSKGGTNVVTTSSWSLHRDFVFRRPALWKVAHSSLLHITLQSSASGSCKLETEH